MAHLPDFISDLAIILITAGIVTIIFKRLKQPAVLGYIVAGFLASLHFKNSIEHLVGKITNIPQVEIAKVFNQLPEISDMANVNVWAEIGVIFLLFALGLEFSFKKLMDVGGTASIGTLINLGAMIIIGYIVGEVFVSKYLSEWSQLDSMFLGGMLSMSSTTIIIKAFNDMGLQKKKFAGIVFGMLIVEDLAAILMMVLLSTLAVSQHFEGSELMNSMLKLIFFMLIWFIVGIYLIPTMLKKLKKYLNDETLLIVAIGLCLGMVLFASYVGFSAALGAFIMGSILAETIESKHIEHLVEPIKNLFGAVFFVSVGMMIDPKIIIEYATIIVVLTLVVLIGRVIFATLGVMASGQGLKVSIQSGLSLAQIGEFSFIIATLGMSLGVINEAIYPIIVSVSVITTFTTPYFIKAADPLYNWLEKKVPAKWSIIIKGYAASSYKKMNKENSWVKFLTSMLSLIAIYGSICIAIILIGTHLIIPFITSNIPNIWGSVLSALIVLVLMAPFMRSIIMKKNRSDVFRSLWRTSNINKGGLVLSIVLRIILCVVFIAFVLIPLFPQVPSIFLILASIVIIIPVIYTKGFKTQSRMLETQFLANLNRKQELDEKKAAFLPSATNDLLSKNIHIEEIEIPQTSPSIGKTLRELNFRQKTGVNIVTIIRGKQKINIPDADTQLYPFDKIVVAGSDDELQKLIQYLEERNQSNAEEENIQYHVDLCQYPIESESCLIGKSIIQAGIREKTECMIIGIDRDSQSLTNFNPTFVFEEGDVLWLAGETEKLASFEDNLK